MIDGLQRKKKPKEIKIQKKISLNLKKKLKKKKWVIIVDVLFVKIAKN